MSDILTTRPSYSAEDRQKAVDLVLIYKQSIAESSRRTGISASSIKNWVRRVAEGLPPLKGVKPLPQKAEAIALVCNQGYTYAQVSQLTGVPLTTIAGWVQKEKAPTSETTKRKDRADRLKAARARRRF